jgi:hypothetical protein
MLLCFEAAVYSARYKRQSQLLDFYQKTMQQSPRDYRWAMVVAELRTSLENYPAAIEAYGLAITIRPIAATCELHAQPLPTFETI